MTNKEEQKNEAKSIYENAFMTCKTCGETTSNDKERAEHVCKEQKLEVVDKEIYGRRKERVPTISH